MGKTLLLADDSVTIQKVVGISFANEDIKITTVDNGDDALKKAKALRPDVVLADVVMPGKSGYEVCQALKADPELRHIPVLLLTGTFEAFDEGRAAQVGAAGHIAKPFEAQTLVERVKELLGRAPAPASQPAAAPAARPAAPVSASAVDDAFDFFDDEAAATLPPADARSGSGAPTPDDSFDLGSSDAAFAFGDDDLSLTPPSGPTPDSTVAILPDEAPPASAITRPDEDAGLTTLDPTMFAEPPEPPPPPTTPSPDLTTIDTSMFDDPAPVPAQPADAGFDFAFDSAESESAPDAALMGGDDLAHATILDPVIGANFAVSSSDLESTLSGGAPPSAAPGTPYPEIEFSDASDLAPGDDLLAAEPLDDDSDEVPSARASLDVPATPPVRSARPERADALMAPDRMAPMPGGSGWDAGESESLALADEDPGARAPAPAARAAASAVSADAVVERMAPALRGELHETLEKIAWEAFGQLTEKIVEDVVQRLEKVAWEVVPKLAEALIQEEIRKLKGESQ
jgi:CheY-like chemotaxis protein